MLKKYSWAEAEAIINKNQDDKLIFLEFTTTWCGDCQMMRPIVQQVVSKYSNNPNIQFIEVDAEEAQLFRNPDTKWKVLKVPTLMLIQGQEILEKGYEYIPAEILESWIDKKVS
ncbi:thioredoxin family protein [Mycoplasmopsis gallopavonis]|uniref:Thioredoxin n=1 Tax=Mycoplasmopsis gallopavonis TaxID=76629 RepID=A0A449AYU4_9BACT|nr:thioredoxin family protein [Mycoplasmopsis gallopavonis]RIV16578.1 thioredoxin [Mycoplasmopsis gallopavonis]VEU72708.1 Thioredoxin [Mycoplasmopsis gallopavonis]